MVFIPMSDRNALFQSLELIYSTMNIDFKYPVEDIISRNTYCKRSISRYELEHRKLEKSQVIKPRLLGPKLGYKQCKSPSLAKKLIFGT